MESDVQECFHNNFLPLILVGIDESDDSDLICIVIEYEYNLYRIMWLSFRYIFISIA